MGKKRTKIIGAEEFEGLAPEDLLKRPKRQADIRTEERKDIKTARPTEGSLTIDEKPVTSQPATSEPVVATKAEVKKVVAKRRRLERRKDRSVAYQKAISQIDRKKVYKLTEAIEWLKKISYTKFDPTVELHVHTLAKKGQESIRYTLVLPAGAVKQPKVRVIDEVALQDIEAGIIDFDIAIATPAIMPKLAKFAKVLGPRGLMPNPKAGTVTDDPQKALEQFQKGQIEVRSDTLGNVHVGLAKLSWDSLKIIENVKAVMSRIPSPRIDSITLTSTMSPGLKIAL